MPDAANRVLGTPCCGCGLILTAENLAYVTQPGDRVGPLGVCKLCKPEPVQLTS